MEDEFEDFSVSSPFEALVAHIQDVCLLCLQLLIPLCLSSHAFFSGTSQMAAAPKLTA
jgi:hypothetical protein